MDKDAWKRNSKEGSWRYDVVMPGFKYNMTDIQAAIGLVQLRKLDAMDARRRQIVQVYQEELGKLGVFDLPVEREDCRSAWHLYPIRLKEGALGISRDRFIEEMKQRNIGTSVHFIPVHTFTYYREKYGFADDPFPVTQQESGRILSLPLHAGLSADNLREILFTVRSSLDEGTI
jgi:dTDP-4-amino-4,6-dideoxygalactose transaminase